MVKCFLNLPPNDTEDKKSTERLSLEIKTEKKNWASSWTAKIITFVPPAERLPPPLIAPVLLGFFFALATVFPFLPVLDCENKTEDITWGVSATLNAVHVKSIDTYASLIRSSASRL